MRTGLFRPWPRKRPLVFAGLVLGVVWLASAQPAATPGANNPAENSLSPLMMAAKALFGLVLFAGLAWLAQHLKRWVLARSTHFATQRTERLASPGLRGASSRTVVAVLRA